MTPAPTPSKLPGPLVFLLSFLLGAGCVGLIGGAVAWGLAKRTELNVRRGWNLVPVVVAARDLVPGTTLSPEDVAQRSIPEQFVTASLVRPEAMASLLGKPVNSPIAAGEPLRGSFVTRLEGLSRDQDRELLDACADEVSRRWAGEVDQTPEAQRARVRRMEAP
jgi:hypothetical protein